MAVFYSRYIDALMIRCDCCRETVKIYENQTDRLLANDWIKENNWKTQKINNKFMNFCPYCAERIKQKLVERVVDVITKGD